MITLTPIIIATLLGTALNTIVVIEISTYVPRANVVRMNTDEAPVIKGDLFESVWMPATFWEDIPAQSSFMS